MLLIIGCIVRSGWFAILVSDGTCDLECAGEGGGSGIRIQTMTVRYYVAFCTRLAQAKSAVGAIVKGKVITPISACVAKVMPTTPPCVQEDNTH